MLTVPPALYFARVLLDGPVGLGGTNCIIGEIRAGGVHMCNAICAFACVWTYRGREGSLA